MIGRGEGRSGHREGMNREDKGAGALLHPRKLKAENTNKLNTKIFFS